MKKVLLPVVLLMVVLSAVVVMDPQPVLALPCCNNMGSLLCDPEAPEWQIPWWSWWNGHEDITISVFQCYHLSCESIDFPLPTKNGLKIGDDASVSSQCSNTTIVQNSARKFCQENRADDYAAYQLRGLAGGQYTYYDRVWRTDKSMYCYITDLQCLGGPLW